MHSPRITAIDSASCDVVLPHAVQLALAHDVQRWLRWPLDEAPCPDRIKRRGIRARDRLVTSNLRLIVTLIGKYKHLWRDDLQRRDDLFQDCVISLMHGIEKFDPTRGYQFSTYAYWWIRHGLTRSTDGVVRIPADAAADRARLERLISDFTARNGRRPTQGWLQHETGFPASRIRKAIVAGHVRVRSLDYSCSHDSGTTLVELIADSNTLAEEELLIDQQAQAVEQILQELDETDQVMLRHFLDGGRIKDLAEASDCCSETARKRFKAALKRAAGAAERLQLDSDLLAA